MTGKDIAIYGLAMFVLCGIFIIWFIALLKPEQLTAEGGMVVAASIALATLIVQFFYRKAQDTLADKKIKALRKKVATLIAKQGKGESDAS